MSIDRESVDALADRACDLLGLDPEGGKVMVEPGRDGRAGRISIAASEFERLLTLAPGAAGLLGELDAAIAEVEADARTGERPAVQAAYWKGVVGGLTRARRHALTHLGESA